MNKNTKGLIYVLICVFLWSLIPVVSRLGQQELDNFQFLFWSSLLSFLVIGSSTLFTKKYKVLTTYKKIDYLKLATLGFLGAFLYYLLLYFGYANGNGLEVLTMQYTWPIFIVVLSFLILGEKQSLRNIIAILLGFVAILLIITKGNITSIEFSGIGTMLIVLVGALSFALFSVLSKKFDYEPYSSTSIFFLSATVFSCVSMFMFSEFTTPSIKELPSVILNGVLINGYSYILWLLALKHARASFLAPFVFLTPIISTILLLVIFQEPFLPIYGVGLILIVASGLLAK